MVGRRGIFKGPGAVKRYLSRDILSDGKNNKTGWPYQSAWHCYLPDSNKELPDTVEEEKAFYAKALEYAEEFPKTYGEQFRGQPLPETPTQNMTVGPNSETPPPLFLKNQKTAIVLWKMGDGNMCLNGPNPGAPSEEVYKLVNDRDKQEYGSKHKWDQTYLDTVVSKDWAEAFRAAFLGNITLIGKNSDSPDVYQGTKYMFDGTEPCGSTTAYTGPNCAGVQGGSNSALLNKLCNTSGSRTKMYDTIENDSDFDEYNLIVHIVAGCWTAGGASPTGDDGRKHLYIFLSPVRGLPGTPYWGMTDDREWQIPYATTDYPTSPWYGCYGSMNFDAWDNGILKWADFKDVHENRGYINMALHEYAHNLVTQGFGAGFSHLHNFNVPQYGGCSFLYNEQNWPNADCSSSYSSQNTPCYFLSAGPDGGGCQDAAIFYVGNDIYDVMGTVGAYNVSQEAPKIKKMGYTAFGGGTVQPNVPMQNWRGIIPDDMTHDLTSENQNASNWSWEGWLDAADYMFKFPEDPPEGKKVMIKTVLESNRPKPPFWMALDPVPRRFLNIVYYSRGHIDQYGPRRRSHTHMEQSGPFGYIESPRYKASDLGVLMVYWGPWSTVNGLNSFAAMERVVDLGVDPNNEKFEIESFTSAGLVFPGWKVYVVDEEQGVAPNQRRKIKIKITKG